MEILICILVILFILSPINITKIVEEDGSVNIKIRCGKKAKEEDDEE